MSKQPKFEWLIADQEETWEQWEERRLSEQTRLDATTARRRRVYRICMWGLVLLLAAGASYWQWRQRIVAKQQMRTTLQAIVDQQKHEARVDQASPLAVLSVPHDVAGARITVQTVTLRDDKAMAQVTIAMPATEPRRTTWFYEQSATGWQRSRPDLRFWGAPESLETPYFRFIMRNHDAPAVHAVADYLDARYPILRSTLGLSPFVREQTTIIVTVEAAPLPDQHLAYAGGPMTVAAPALYTAPISLSETEILSQAVMLLLGTKVLQEWSETVTIPDEGLRWPIMMTALRLWQIWETAGPLAIGRREIVQGLYHTQQDLSGRSMRRQLPASYDQICTAFQTWHLSAKLLIPLACSAEDPEFWYAQPAPLHLRDLARSLGPEDIWLNPKTDAPGEVVALATLLEYVVEEYGRSSLPALLIAFGHHRTWETLIPTVFNTSAAKFEHGWHQYLVNHYSVVLP